MPLYAGHVVQPASRRAHRALSCAHNSAMGTSPQRNSIAGPTVCRQIRSWSETHQVGCGGGHELHDDEQLAGSRLDQAGEVLRDGVAAAIRQHRHLPLDVLDVVIAAGEQALWG